MKNNIIKKFIVVVLVTFCVLMFCTLMTSCSKSEFVGEYEFESHTFYSETAKLVLKSDSPFGDNNASFFMTINDNGTITFKNNKETILGNYIIEDNILYFYTNDNTKGYAMLNDNKLALFGPFNGVWTFKRK